MDFLDGSTIIAFIIAMTVVIVAVGFFSRGQSKHSVEHRIKKIARQGHSNEEQDATLRAIEEYDDAPSASAELMQRILEALNIDPADHEKNIRLRFDQAGVRNPHAATYYLFMKKLGMPIAIVIAIMMMLGDQQGFLKVAAIIVSLILIFIGYYGADLYLKNMKDKRQFVLQRSFPDALDLILVCVEAGLALDAALARVCREMEHTHSEITYELNKTRMELTLLNDRSKALQNLAERTDLVSFRALCSALLQSEKFGTSLTDTLRVLSEDYRNTRMLIAENKANKLPALITIPIMVLMMPAFLMLIMAPAIITLMANWTTG